MSHNLYTKYSEMEEPENISDKDFIKRLTSREVALSIPVLCFILLLMFVGTFGNVLVILTYARRLQKSSTNLFIFCLAVFDTLNCCLSLPMEVFDILNPYTNDLHYLCAIHKFIAFSADLSSGYIIVCISFDRYLRIARPHHHGLNVGHSKKAVITISVVSLLITSLALLIYGTEKVTLASHSGVLGYRCGIHGGLDETILPLLFNTLILVLFGVGVVILLTVYTRLGIRVRDWNKGRSSKDTRSRSYLQGATMYSEESSSKVDNEDSPEGTVPKAQETKQTNTCRFPSVTDDKNTDEAEMESFKKPAYVRELSRSLDRKNFVHLENVHLNGTKTLPLIKKSTSFRSARKASLPALIYLKRRITLSKTTIMFIAATVAFVASHVPYVCTKMASVLRPDIKQNMTSVEYSLFRFAEFSFIVSYGVNPLIYSFLNPKFRNECKTLLEGVIKKVKCHTRSRTFYLQ